MAGNNLELWHPHLGCSQERFSHKSRAGPGAHTLTLGVCSAQSCPCVTSFHPHAHSLQEVQSTPVTQHTLGSQRLTKFLEATPVKNSRVEVETGVGAALALAHQRHLSPPSSHDSVPGQTTHSTPLRRSWPGREAEQKNASLQPFKPSQVPHASRPPHRWFPPLHVGTWHAPLILLMQCQPLF